VAIRANSWRFPAALLLATSFFCAFRADSQVYTPPPPKLTPGPCVPTKEFPCDPPAAKTPPLPAKADKFPFPGSDPGTNPENAAPVTPQQPTDPNAKPAPSQQFPFPGEPAAADAPAAPADGKKPDFAQPGGPDAPASSSSSSDSSTPADGSSADSASQPPLKDAGSTGSTRFQRKHLAKVEDLDHRELEDLDVSHYYYTTGNFIASYSRAQDALKLYPDDENAHFAVAAAAEKLGKKDEAIAEYKVYLQLAPDGTKAKQAKRGLENLQPH
jgi:hypothetical protein